MIVAEVNLVSAISSSRDENLCRVEVVNDGTGTSSRGNYEVRLYARGNGRLIRRARVDGWARNAHPAWRLFQAAMNALDSPVTA